MFLFITISLRVSVTTSSFVSSVRSPPDYSSVPLSMSHLHDQLSARDFLISVSICCVIKLGFCVHHPSVQPLSFVFFFPPLCHVDINCVVTFLWFLTSCCSPFDGAAGVTKGKPGSPGPQVNQVSHQFSHVCGVAELMHLLLNDKNTNLPYVNKLKFWFLFPRLSQTITYSPEW